MANATTPSAALISSVDAGAGQPEKQHKPRPEKPNEQQYKEDLAKAEKEHAAVQEKLVRKHTNLEISFENMMLLWNPKH